MTMSAPYPRNFHTSKNARNRPLDTDFNEHNRAGLLVMELDPDRPSGRTLTVEAEEAPYTQSDTVHQLRLSFLGSGYRQKSKVVSIEGQISWVLILRLGSLCVQPG